MPMLIETIDRIARIKARDVLYISFNYDMLCPKENTDDDDNFNKMFSYDYANCLVRQQLIDWLEQNQIAYQPCLPFSSSILMGGYFGHLYVDIPYDESLPDYQKLSQHLETAEGQMKIKGLVFCYLPLEPAMTNKHRDKPDF